MTVTSLVPVLEDDVMALGEPVDLSTDSAVSSVKALAR